MMKATTAPAAHMDLFREAMSRFASGVTAITTLDGDAPIGLIATSVCSVSAEPPTLLVCVNKSATAHDVILRERRFAVNLLASSQKSVAQRFASRKGADRFDPEVWTTLATGAPILKEAVAAFDCKVLDLHDGYTHTIIVGVIEGVSVGDDAHASCLLWHQRDFARSALFGE